MASIGQLAAVQYAGSSGFSNTIVPGTIYNQIQVIVGIAGAESGYDPAAQHRNSDGSLDRGILQINSFWHSEVSDAQAYDPQQAFLAAYRISGHGLNFNAWSTFKSGAYTRFIPTHGPSFQAQTPLTTQSNTFGTVTPDQVFTTLGLVRWWNNPHADFFGQDGEKGQDYGVGQKFDVPVGALMGGQVVAILTNGPSPFGPGNDAVGFVVQIMTPSDGIHHYQHLHTTTLKKGDKIGVGDIVGLSGGCADGNYGSNNACVLPNAYSTGGHIEVRWAPAATRPGWTQVWSDPKDHFGKLAQSETGAGPLGVGSGPGGLDLFSSLTNIPFFDAAGTIIGNVAKQNPLKPDDTTATFLTGLDHMFTVVNPFDVPDVATISVFGGTIPNPLDYLGRVAENIGFDIAALTLHTLFLLLGTYLIFKVLGSFVNIQGLEQKAAQVAPILAAAA